MCSPYYLRLASCPIADYTTITLVRIPYNMAAQKTGETSPGPTPLALPDTGNAHLRCTVNGEEFQVSVAPYKTLLEVLREDLGLAGTKHGCELGECGACTVLMDGKPVLSCLTLALDAAGHDIETVEAMSSHGQLHPLQSAFADLGAAQCGYCTSGMLLTLKSLLETNPAPTREQIREALSGNLCRCTGYQQIFEAAEHAAAELNSTGARTGTLDP